MSENRTSLKEWLETANAVASIGGAEALELELQRSDLSLDHRGFVESFLQIKKSLLRSEASRTQSEPVRAQWEGEIAQLESEIAKSEALRVGTFYSRIDEVFKQNVVDGGKLFREFTKDDYMKSCRPRYQTSAEREEEENRHAQEQQQQHKQQQQKQGRKRGREEEAKPSTLETPVPLPKAASENERTTIIMQSRATKDDVYQITYSAAASKAARPATTGGQSRSSNHSKTRRAVWKKTVVGVDHSGHIAHLVPSAVLPADSYWFVTDFLFGFDARRTWEETQCLIHGSNASTEAKQIRKTHTGIKHMITNKVLLPAQQEYFNDAPCVIVVPILSVQEALDWTGEAYHAIMLIDHWDDEDDDNKISLFSVCSATGFSFNNDSIPKASGSDLTKARDLLNQYNKAILYAQQNRKPTEVAFSLGADSATAFFPDLPSGDLDTLKVRKICFEDNSSDEGHPAPDPLLLVTKSIAVLQKRHGFSIVAATEPVGDYLPSDLSLQAEEEWLRRREEALSHHDPVGLNITVHR